LHEEYGFPSLSTQAEENYPIRPSFAVSHAYKRMYAWIKFNQDVPEDTFNIQLVMFKNGQEIAYGYARHVERDADWHLMQVPIYYNQQLIPDSAAINLQIFNQNHTGPYSKSSCLIDLISFDIEQEPFFPNSVVRMPESVPLPYPNPSQGSWYLDRSLESVQAVKLYAMDGKEIPIECVDLGNRIKIISQFDLKSGTYYLHLKGDVSWNHYKLVVAP
ncbi:MAG: T9SS type A sorting domain-containing protein, partial [Bacteroidota bacterium]|nr:T9SS type A sorting domain-containing protein [Bacteroidota bacterium]MDX5429608.1 T9SS type A sorting domain-containing protein [Bacteroidota bacterium]MDX5468392.1 T9SS type A sorting domain-containing protein [Bacteroidota bacterium]